MGKKSWNQRFKDFACWLFKHKWETYDWYYKKGNFADEDLKHRKDVCLRCGKKTTEKDDRAPMMLDYKRLVYEQRRQVIVEKHKNPKEYIIRGQIGTIYSDIKTEVMILDKDVEETKNGLRQLCITHNVREDFLRLIRVGEKELPEELRDK